MRRFILILLACMIMSHLVINPCFADPWRKLGRGITNAVTGILEVPKKVIQVSKEDGLLKGLTLGLVEGAATGLLRTGAGVYEVATFPIPAPADYEPIVEPEFVFDEWE